ncbi:hypothetical protein X801_02595, partial [Opisthorchis viverrini]
DTDKPIALVHTTASGSDLCQIVCEDITQFYVTLANEPSLAYFRIQEHIRKVTPSLSNERSKIVQVNSELQGCCFDVDYSISAVNSASRATPHLNRLNELLKSSLFTKLQLDYAKKYSTGFEVGVDLVSALASQQQPTMSTTSRKKIPAGSQLPSSSYSFGRNTSPTVEPVNSSPSTTLAGSSQLTGALLTTAIRQNPASINKRAEVTRSADFSGLNGSNLSTSLRNGKARSVVLNPSYSFSYGVSPDQSAETGVEAVELHDSTDYVPARDVDQSQVQSGNDLSPVVHHARTYNTSIQNTRIRDWHRNRPRKDDPCRWCPAIENVCCGGVGGDDGGDDDVRLVDVLVLRIF